MASLLSILPRVPLAALAEVVQGYATRGGARAEPSGITRVIFGRDLRDDGSISWDRLASCPADADLDRFGIRVGDVLLTTRALVPRAAVVVDPPPQVVAGAQLAILRPNSLALNAGYLAWFLNRAETRAELDRLALGSSIRFLPIAALRDFKIPLPPIERQSVITHIADLRRRETELLFRLNRARDVLLDAAALHPLPSRSSP